METKSLKVKTSISDKFMSTSLADPGSMLGDFRNKTIQIREVVNIPLNVSSFEVLKAFRNTIDLSQLFNPKMVFNFNEIGNGKIVR